MPRIFKMLRLMKLHYLLIFAATSLSLLTNSCGGKDSGTGFETQSDLTVEPVKIQRLDKDIEGYIRLDSAKRRNFIDSNRDVLLGFGQFVDEIDTVTNQVVAMWSTWPATFAFMPEVNRIYKNMEPEEKALARIMETSRQNDIQLPAKRFVTVTWGRPQSIMILDSAQTVYIALNHYLGPKNNAYKGWPAYKTNLKIREMIPVDVAEALIATARPYEPKENATVLSRLLYEGSVAVAKEAFVPDAPLNLILGFTDQQLKSIQDNEAFMWRQLADENKIYSTDEELKSNLFDLRPTSSRISNDAPGRAVRYIGYRIVREYLKRHPEKTLNDLLSPDFYDNSQAVLKESGYKPAN